MLRAAVNFTAQTIAVGVVSGLAMYLYSLNDSERVRPRTAVIRALSGGVWGFLGAKIGAGMGLDHSMQTAAAGVGGAKGPEYLDRLADRITGVDRH